MLTCRQCRRANPEHAAFCWYDGVHLDSPMHRADPSDLTPRRFLQPLVLRSGAAIASFADLARLAGSHWEELLQALRDGSLEKLFQRIKRDDLAQRAAWAAKHADPEQALDELLDRLPEARREPARIEVDPAKIDLGSINRTTPRTLTLRIFNRGQGLVQGTVRVEGAAWLSLDNTSGVQKKLFRCPRELAVPVRVVGRALRASKSPIEGKLIVESNGGTIEIPVRALVAVQPFGEGVLSGARSPGELAEKARLAPKEAAALFERGLVVAWYESNGWIYPVNGPLAEGLGAVQQFFEALGRAVPPRVTLAEDRVELRGLAGESVQSKIVLSTTEPRTVYCHGTSNADWLEVGRPTLDGQRATLPLRVRQIPDRPNQKLRARVDVGSNGGQTFKVDVVLHVMPGTSGRRPAPATADAGDWLFGNTPPQTPAQPLPQPVHRPPVSEPVPIPTAWLPPVTATPPTPIPTPQPTYTVTPTTRREAAPEPEPEPRRTPWWLLVLPPLLFALGLTGLVLHDVWLPDKAGAQAIEIPEGPLDPVEYVKLDFNDRKRNDDIGKDVGVNMTFGLQMKQENKKLIYDEWGRTNNTCVKIDGNSTLFGMGSGQWVVPSEAIPPEKAGDPSPGRRAVWRTADGNVEIAQDVELRRGDLSRKFDTALVRYTLKNVDSRRHEVGLRFMLDSLIGNNDGVPFTIPGDPNLCNTMREFSPANRAPDYLEALEHDDLANPGTIAHLRLKLGSKVEAPGRVTLGSWPDDSLKRLPQPITSARAYDTMWEVPVVSMRALTDARIRYPTGAKSIMPPDSAVTLYWNPQPLDPGATRVVGFTYGLGQVASGKSEGKMALTVGGRLVKNGEFTLTALVSRPTPGETLTVELPADVRVVSGETKQEVPPVAADAARPISTLTWRLTARSAGSFPITVRSSRGHVETTTLSIRSQGVFD